MAPCAYPDATLGVVLRFSGYLDCQARVLGEAGFQAFIGSPIIIGLLSALVTIFVALIGYRLILGEPPGVRDGIGWAVRLGLVLALVTGWPAFQTLVYRVAVDGPADLTGTLLPAGNLSADSMDVRVQQAYDTMRLGHADQTAAGGDAADQGQQNGPATTRAATPATGSYAQPALPQTAAIFAVSTAGMMGALRLAVGLLLALAPLAILGLLFDATLGLFSGWVRALAGSALGVVAASVVSTLDLTLVEGELGSWQSIERGVTVIDPQGLTTIVLCFVPVILAAIWAAARMAGAFRFDRAVRRAIEGARDGIAGPLAPTAAPGLPVMPPSGGSLPAIQTRARGIADALATTVQRERSAAAGASVGGERMAGSYSGTLSRQGAEAGSRQTTSRSSRRLSTRRTRSAVRRDRA